MCWFTLRLIVTNPPNNHIRQTHGLTKNSTSHIHNIFHKSYICGCVTLIIQLNTMQYNTPSADIYYSSDWVLGVSSFQQDIYKNKK